MLSGVVGCAFLATCSAWADDPMVNKAPPPVATGLTPAVDSFNSKFEALGGSVSGLSLYGVNGSVTVPVSDAFGAQVDGLAGSLGGSTVAGVAGHWFWRDPNTALLGLYGSETHWDRLGGLDVVHLGVEGERYWGPFTLQGVAGVEFGNSRSTTVTTVGPIVTSTVVNSFNIATRYFDEINLRYYFTEDSNGYVGHRYLGGKNALALGAEFAQPLGHGVMASLFVEGDIGEDNFNGAWGGLKFYFGPNDKTLKDRHRREDPNNWNVDNLGGATNGSNSGNGNTTTTQSCTNGINPETGTCFGPPD
jgi:hypothetical protein